MIRAVALLTLTLALAACDNGSYNGDHHYLRLTGDVSLGQHLLDLKSALDAGALTQEEFDALKGSVLDMATGACDRID